MSALKEAGYDADSIIIEPTSSYTAEWTVCSQTPSPGTATKQVRLIIGRLCRDGKPVDPLHEGQETFTGIVTDYDEAWSEPLVLVDEAIIGMDLIHTLGETECLKTGERFHERAVQALAKALPIGTPVYVVRASRESDQAFVHSLEAVSDEPSPTPPFGSVNEDLVATGYWTPSQDAFNMPDKGQTKSGYKSSKYYVNSTESSYGPLIAKAATKARLHETKGQKACVAEAQRKIAKRQAAKAAAEAAARERRYQRWLDQQNADNGGDDEAGDNWTTPAVPNPPSGEHPCLPGERDGDGDGICAEE